MKYYTGVGSRQTPSHILDVMRDFAFKVSQEDWVLRSGGAEGADTAFEEGSLNSFAGVIPEIYLPWVGFNGHDVMSKEIIIPKLYKNWNKAQNIAEDIHPYWDKCSPAAKTLHTRNVYQVLGKDLESPSKFLICYAPPVGDSISGGTRTAWELARINRIPCYNLFHEDVLKRIEKYLKG